MLLNFNVPVKGNEKLSKLLEIINKENRIAMLLRASNINAIDRLGLSDHGPTHVKIVANVALKMLRLLNEQGVHPSAVKNYGLGMEDAEVIVILASLLHDVGLAIHREGHEEYSIMIALEVLRDILLQIYDEEKAVIIKSEVLHAMVSHHKKPYTVEGGVVRIADGLDMAKGRARIPFTVGKVNIHSVSALAIESISIGRGEEVPIDIKIRMTNSAGIFQVDELLKEKIKDSGLEEYILVEAEIIGEEKKIVERIKL